MGLDVTCPGCGLVFEPTVEVGDSLGHQLSELIDGGMDVDTATDKALSEIPSAVAQWVRLTVRQQAERIQRRRNAKVEDRAIGTDERWAQRNEKLARKLLATTFTLGHNVEVTWGEATPEQHRVREALYDKQIRGNLTAKARHTRARGLISAAGVTCLNEVHDAERLMADDSPVELARPAASAPRARRGTTKSRAA